MPNTMADLQNHLFSQLERLGKPDMTADEIDAEVKRAAAIVDVADQVVEGNKLNLAAAKLFAEHGRAVLPMLPQIVSDKTNDAKDTPE